MPRRIPGANLLVEAAAPNPAVESGNALHIKPPEAPATCPVGRYMKREIIGHGRCLSASFYPITFVKEVCPISRKISYFYSSTIIQWDKMRRA